MRHKEIHLYNISPILKFVVDAGKSIISSKIKDRINVSYFFLPQISINFILQVHLNTEDMKKSIVSVDVLPKEMGGKIPMSEMIQHFKMELATSRNALIALDKMKILDDSGIVGRRNADKNNNTLSEKTDQVVGSFRKLEID